MKQIRSLVHSLVACGIALSLVSIAAAQTPIQGTATVVRKKGSARYSTGNNVWQPLKVGAVLRPGTVIQTSQERGSFVELALGDSDAALRMTSNAGGGGASASSSSDSVSYQP